MGESYPRCILTGEKITDECVVFLLGPDGYGPHDVPPTKEPGGCNLPFTAQDTVSYWPLTLPLRASVGHTWGNIRTVEDTPFAREQGERLGVDLVEMFNSVVCDGAVLSPALRRSAEVVKQDYLRIYSPATAASEEEIIKTARATYVAKLAQNLLTEYQIENGPEEAIRVALETARGTARSRERLVDRAWCAKWADIAHISVEAWDSLCNPANQPRKGVPPFPEKRSWESNDDMWLQAARDYGALCNYSVLVYREFLHTPEAIAAQKSLLLALQILRNMSGELRPSVIYQDTDDDTLRLQALRLMVQMEERKHARNGEAE